eukprot:1960069-Rhodomonas_salina.2
MREPRDVGCAPTRREGSPPRPGSGGNEPSAPDVSGDDPTSDRVGDGSSWGERERPDRHMRYISTCTAPA